MIQAEVMDLTVVCQSFPRMPVPEVHRDNILSTMDAVFGGETELVVVEGEEGIGKTTLLAQFARRHPGRALSLFARATSHWTYDPHVLRYDLCNQLQWVLHQEELTTTSMADDAFLRSRLIELRRRARRRKETFYFVVDGLDEVPEEHSHIRGLISDMLPWGLSGFRFLLAGELGRLSHEIPQGVPSKPFPVSYFSLDETVKYLGDLVQDHSLLEEIHRICRGIPGYLSSVRRSLTQPGMTVQSLLNEMANKPPDFFEIEWRRVRSDDERQMILLAILAHDRKRHRLEDLGRVLDMTLSAIQELLRDLKFVTVDDRSREASFVSESFRRFAANRLQDCEGEVRKLLIDDLFRDPGSQRSLAYLPGYLEWAGRKEDLLGYLSPENFARLLTNAESLSPVLQTADLGVRTAIDLRRDGDLMRFALQRSAMKELGGAEVWRSEVEAQMALRDYESALTLAQTTVLQEDRLHLLAVIARAKREQGLAPEPELMEQIRQLCGQIDATALGDRAIDVASDLIYSDFDLAIDFVEKATSAGGDMDENALDWAFAKLSIAAHAIPREQTETTDCIESIRARIKNPKLRWFSAAASFLLGDYSAVEVVAHAKQLESAGEGLFLLRQWALDNKEREDAAQVVDFALSLLIKTTEYSPNARDYLEIAAPLPFIDDVREAKELVGRLDGQRGAIERKGPTEDYVGLQLLLAQAEAKYDFEAARSRLVDVYLYINELGDLATKTACMAKLAASLIDIDPEKQLEPDEGIHSLVREELKSDIEQLLAGTAEHYHATRAIVRVLARVLPSMALKVALDLNTEGRRDLALLELVESSVQVPVSEIDLAFVRESIDRIVDPDLRDETLVKVIERAFAAQENLQVAAQGSLPFITRIKDIQDVTSRCRAYCLAYRLLMRCNFDKYSQLASNLLRRLKADWQIIDRDWHRVDVGFKIAESLASESLEIGREYLELTDEFRRDVFLDTFTAAWTYIASLRLAIRAYAGLLPRSLNTEDDEGALGRLIRQIPSTGKQVELWAELALRCHARGRLQDCRRIVTQHVKPLLQAMLGQDASSRSAAIVKAAPALYCAHGPTALDLVLELPPSGRDAAYRRICLFLLRKKPPSDPYQSVSGQAYDVTFEELVDVCGLLEGLEEDRAIVRFVRHIADSIIRNRSFTREQKADIANRLDKVIDKKLPNPRYIKHEGYRICARVQVARILRAGHQTWIDLINSARTIRNLADRALTLSVVAFSMPYKLRSRRANTIEEAKGLIERIPTILDRVSRYEAFAEMALDKDPPLARQCLQSAMNTAVTSETPQLYSAQRRIIDLAYRFDPDLAGSLASLADDDPARWRIRANLQRRLQILDLKKKMIEQAPPDLDAINESMYPQASWKLLGALNAGRGSLANLPQMRKTIAIAARLPLRRSYSMLAWTIENAVQRFAKTPSAVACLRPMFDAALRGVELAAEMAKRSSTELLRAKTGVIKQRETKSALIRAHDREGAIQFLREWFADEVRDYLKICDPYFGPDDLEILHILQSVSPKCKVQILTSIVHQRQKGVRTPWSETYRNHWRIQVADQDPPETEVIIAGTEPGGKLPIHDRWWLTHGAGIRLGTSYHDLGGERSSEISSLSQEEAEEREREVDQYLRRVRRQHGNARLIYESFTL